MKRFSHRTLGGKIRTAFCFCLLTNKSGLRREVPDGDGDLFHNVLANHLDVVLQLGGDGNDGSTLGYCACRTDVQLVISELLSFAFSCKVV